MMFKPMKKSVRLMKDLEMAEELLHAYETQFEDSNETRHQKGKLRMRISMIKKHIHYIKTGQLEDEES